MLLYEPLSVHPLNFYSIAGKCLCNYVKRIMCKKEFWNSVFTNIHESWSIRNHACNDAVMLVMMYEMPALYYCFQILAASYLQYDIAYHTQNNADMIFNSD
jgi:hypothetical protein